MEGTLRSKGSKEVKENHFEGMKNDEDDVLPLGKTPSPAGVNPPLVQSRITRILNSHPRRSLDPVLDNWDTRVLNVLTKKAVPVILASDTHQNVKRDFCESGQTLPSFHPPPPPAKKCQHVTTVKMGRHCPPSTHPHPPPKKRRNANMLLL